MLVVGLLVFSHNCERKAINAELDAYYEQLEADFPAIAGYLNNKVHDCTIEPAADGYTCTAPDGQVYRITRERLASHAE
jgi:hypothetical protein